MKTIHQAINGRGLREQDQALNFPNLYANGHRLTRNYAGWQRQFATELKRGKFEV